MRASRSGLAALVALALAVASSTAASCSSSDEMGSAGNGAGASAADSTSAGDAKGASSSSSGGPSTTSSTTSTSGGASTSSSGASGGGGAGGGGPDGGGGLEPDPCDETQDSDMAGVTRQCSGDVFDTYTCDTGAACSANGPLTELFNVYGLTPWYGEYGGAVTIDPTSQDVTPVDPGNDFFGAKYAIGQGFDYRGSTESVCFATTSKYIALRIVPNTPATIQLAQDPTFDSARTITISATKPGQFTAGNPLVVCSASGGTAQLELTTNGQSDAPCQLEMGQTYYLNYFDGGDSTNPNAALCHNGWGASLHLQQVN